MLALSGESDVDDVVFFGGDVGLESKVAFLGDFPFFGEDDRDRAFRGDSFTLGIFTEAASSDTLSSSDDFSFVFDYIYIYKTLLIIAFYFIVPALFLLDEIA